MKVRIRNNRLALEGHVTSLAEASDAKLREIAAKYQIGASRTVPKEVTMVSHGKTIVRTEQMVEAKPRKQLEDEIRRTLTITLYVPKEYWTPEQSDAFISNNLLDEKDIIREQEVKKDSKIMQVLMPYEEGVDELTKAKMLGELTEGQWEYFKDVFNKKYTRVKDEDGKTIGKKESYVHRLVVDEFIPENEDERESLKAEAAKKEKVSKTKKEE